MTAVAGSGEGAEAGANGGASSVERGRSPDDIVDSLTELAIAAGNASVFSITRPNSSLSGDVGSGGPVELAMVSKFWVVLAAMVVGSMTVWAGSELWGSPDWISVERGDSSTC
jgi:hypothetical protein